MIVQDHKFTITEINDMMPWEREVYIALIEQRLLEEQKEK